MQNLKALKALANLSPSSPLASSHAHVRKAALIQLAQQVSKSSKLNVGDLVQNVMAVSARTRRTLKHPVKIELDVFTAQGTRAVKLNLG